VKLARKYRKRHRPAGQPRPNPASSFMAEVTDVILPGFAGFAAARFATRMATIAVGKRWPKFARHAGALASLSVLGFSWFGAGRIKAISKYQDGLLLGSSIGTLQTLIQTYIPKLGWIVAEVAPAELAAPAAGALSGGDGLPDEEWGYYNDAFSSGRYPAPVPRSQHGAAPAAVVTASAASSQTAQEQAAIDDFMNEISADVGGGGIFAGGGN